MLDKNSVDSHAALRTAVKFVAVANLAYFFVEFGIVAMNADTASDVWKAAAREGLIRS